MKYAVRLMALLAIVSLGLVSGCGKKDKDKNNDKQHAQKADKKTRGAKDSKDKKAAKKEKTKNRWTLGK
ncbi:hypothetical protein IPF37_00675 [bacterium]|nr:MAG: hypothetical protein IPF37_00675 [bacterium]